MIVLVCLFMQLGLSFAELKLNEQAEDFALNKAVVIIPARYGSTRLEGKALLDQTGKPMVVHVADQAKKASAPSRVIVAADDRRIIDAVERFGHEAVMTRADHVNGTSRVAEAVECLESDVEIIVNVQGDEPLIDPTLIDQLVERMRGGDEPMGTIGSTFSEDEDISNPNVVKVVLNQCGQAMYFSRAAIPHDRDGQGGGEVLKHVGLYAYRRAFLSQYVQLTPTPCEQAERLEQLRVLEHGFPIAVIRAKATHQGVDTIEQYEAFVQAYASRQKE